MKNNFLNDYQRLLSSFEALLVSEGRESFVDLQMILYHLRQIASIYLKHEEFAGVSTTTSFEIRKLLTDIGSLQILPREGEYSIVSYHDTGSAREELRKVL